MCFHSGFCFFPLTWQPINMRWVFLIALAIICGTAVCPFAQGKMRDGLPWVTDLTADHVGSKFRVFYTDKTPDGVVFRRNS